MSVTFQDLRGIAVYRCVPEQTAFPSEEINRQQGLLDRAKYYARAADEASERGEGTTAQNLREYAFYNVYKVARLYFFRLDDDNNNPRLWLCLLAARLALAAGLYAHAQECCEVGLLQVDDEEYADALRGVLGQALEGMRNKVPEPE